MNLRNVAIIAHVDHGKTTLVDAMLRQTGVFRAHETVGVCVMDSNDLERERGITILAKNASVMYKDTKINIIDTPGHADFGGEVERTLKMADGALLLVDAAEGPLPQTRFVLDKALKLGMPIIVVVNKIDRQDARPDDVHNEIFSLFCDLEASDAQSDFKTVYAVGRRGVAGPAPAELGENLEFLFETIMRVVPPPPQDVDAPLQLLVHNIQHDEYLGRLAIGRIHRGVVKAGQQVAVVTEKGVERAKVTFTEVFEGLGRRRVESVEAGDLLAISGIEEIQIGDTITAPDKPEGLPRISVDEPTIKITFTINDSPFAGQSGKWVTSRHIRERLMKEARHNIALRVQETDSPDTFEVFGRGELMLAVLAENMRREGYELSLGMPEVVQREIDGKIHEPVELVTMDVPEEYVGTVTAMLGERRGQMTNMHTVSSDRRRLEFRIPSRGLMGFRSLFLTETRGLGLMSSLFDGWEPATGALLRRRAGSLVADRAGDAVPYAIFHLQPRGSMFIGAGVPVYEGMIIGQHCRSNDLDVNVTKEKKLTNIRAAGKDENTILVTPKTHDIESALEYVDADELVEITPDSVRLRKRILDKNKRPKRREID